MKLAGKILGLATLYILAGKLGLVLAVAPGYATLIWPSSGIALGMLLGHGRSLWPGVLLGAGILFGWVAGIDTGNATDAVIIALVMAIGASAQALVGHALICRFVDAPLRLDRIKHLLLVSTLGGPIACLIAPTLSVFVLSVRGLLSTADPVGTWLTAWSGEVLGVLIFLPLTLVMQRGELPLQWRRHELPGLPLLAALILMLPLALTFYVWRVADQSGSRDSHFRFDSLASESERAFLHRLSSYENAVLGAAAYVQGSERISREGWRSYVDTIRVRENFPGINGIGWIEPVPHDGLREFVRSVQAGGVPGFAIHPAASTQRYDIIRYIEPERSNRAALGLNIAFERNRREAADLSARTGRPAITRRIELVQDDEKTPGFLLLQPLYDDQGALDSPAHRLAALKGWVYAPFVAKNFLAGLTRSQGDTLNLRIYDGREESSASLIFSSGSANTADSAPLFTVRKQLRVLQRDWLIVWQSTPSFEQAERTQAPLLLLIGGVLFTALLALFLIVLFIRRPETKEWFAGERQYALPLFVCLLLAAGSYTLYATLQQKELGYARKLAHDEARKIAQLLGMQTHEKLFALNRMAERWTIGNGTDFQLWQNDARSYTQQFAGPNALQWIDSNYQVRWVEPRQGGQRGVGLDALKHRAKLMRSVADRHQLTLIGPVPLTQGDLAFIAYLPLTAHGQFDGFLAGIFSVHDFFQSAIGLEAGNDYAISMRRGSDEFYHNDVTAPAQALTWASERHFQIHDQSWTLRVVPTQQFIDSQRSSLPITVLIAGLVIAALSALSLRYILVSRVRAADQRRQQQSLTTSAARLRLLVENTPAAVAMFDKHMRYVLASERWMRDYRLEGHSIIGRWHYDVFPEVRDMPRWRDIHQRALNGEVFDIQEDSWLRTDGRYEWIEWAIHPWTDENGEVGGIVMFTEVITARKVAEQALKNSEEMFRMIMEHAPIGQALVDAEGRFVKVNPALCRLLGYSEFELLALDLQSITHPEDLARDQDSMRKLLAGDASTCQLEQRFLHKHRQVIWTLLSICHVQRSAGLGYLIAQIHDITARKEMERIKGEFISVISHELRTPLTSIRGSLGLILGAFAKEIPAKVNSLIEIGHNNCERLILLINDILDIDKIASGHMRLDMKPESLAALIQQSARANDAYARKFGGRIDVHDIDERFIVRVDSGRFIQVLSNLLSNAAKFSPSDGVIEVSVTTNATDVRISVRDQGPGIPTEFQPSIFQKFSQADTSATRQKGGTGLGLHITKQLVEHMHGHIGFDSQPGSGTVFWVEFPLIAAPTPTGVEAPVRRLRERAAVSQARVLHIEDDADLSDMLATALQERAEIVSATTLRQAEALLRQQVFSAIVLDVMLPDGSGLAFLDRLDTLVKPVPPVLILSVDVPAAQVHERVAGVMVKTLMPEQEIADRIVAVMSEVGEVAKME